MFLVSCKDVFHVVLSGGVVNLRFHGGVFDSVAIKTTNMLTCLDNTSMTSYARVHNATRNKKLKL